MTILIDERRRAVIKASGHLLVTGGPGSGKTTLAIHKAKGRIEAGLQPGEAVLFLSFSRAAVARIVEATKLEISKEVQQRFTVQTCRSAESL